ncbi:MAG TPA: COX15/CtaA family protein [Thermoanaerobaculia bacterium]|nr:COX15/CtaA family protein [Thermoanaerobaculia bacterium]
MNDPSARPPFARFAWLTLAYTVAVILFGAWVRITGSGAGCGQHWPSCHGELLHRPESVETLIELTHRVTSAADGLLIVVLVVWSLRAFERRHPARRFAAASLAFVILEGLIGAMLVRFELVVDDDSALRALIMSLHLVNTSLLTGALALTAWSAQGRRIRWRSGEPAGRRARLLLLGGLVAMLVVMMSGAITALGDTLYPLAPDGTRIEALIADQSPTAHFLQRVRLLHPLLACAVTLYLLYMALAVRDRTAAPADPTGPPSPRTLAPIPTTPTAPTPTTRATPARSIRLVKSNAALWVIGLAFLQVVLGVVNIVLSAPGWMQVVHLAGATIYWVVLLLFAAEATACPQGAGAGSEEAEAVRSRIPAHQMP